MIDAQSDVQGADVLPEMRNIAGTRNRHHILAAGKDPGQCHLARPDADLVCDGLYPRLVDTGGGLRGGCQRSGVEGLVGVRGPVSAPGVPPSGVVVGDPAEHLALTCGLVGPGVCVLEDFSFEGGVERFGQAVVGALTG